MGAYVAIAGVVVFTIAVFLDWISVDNENNDSFSGYETDSLIPFVASSASASRPPCSTR
jgi:hypothetical protein